MIFSVLIFAICVQIFLTIKKVSPFLSLLFVSLLTGCLLGMEPSSLLLSIEKGTASTLGGLALVLCLGAIFGKIMEISGAADQITTTIIHRFGLRYVQWGVLVTGFLVGIPLYYNAGFVILVPLVFSIARGTGLPLLYLAIPMAASLSVTHCFLPPHPGPIMLVMTFHANLGKTLVYGMFLAVPTAIIAGPFLGKLYRSANTGVDIPLFLEEKKNIGNKPAVFLSFFIAFIPVFLILLSVLIGPLLGKENGVSKILLFIGDSTISLFIAVLLSIYYFGLKSGKKMTEIMQWVGEAIAGIAMILLIITSGGIFKQVLIDSGAGATVANFCKSWQMHPLVFGWMITAILRVTIGSATVAGLTAAGIVSPLLTGSEVSPELMVLAVGAGSVFGSHINDTGFWMFKEFFNLSLKQTFFSWTLMEIIISVLGLCGVLVLDFFI